MREEMREERRSLECVSGAPEDDGAEEYERSARAEEDAERDELNETVHQRSAQRQPARPVIRSVPRE